MYSSSVFFKDKLMLYVFKSLKWKTKIQFETRIENAWNLDFHGGKNDNLHKFLNIFELTVENIKHCLGKTLFKIWSQIYLKKIAYVSTKLL